MMRYSGLNSEYIDLGNPESEFHQETGWLMANLGRLLAIHSEMELIIETAIARLTGMSHLNASIVLADLQFGSKTKILKCLLAEAGRDEDVAALAKAVNAGRRNMLVHSYPDGDEGGNSFTFMKRDISRLYSVNRWEMTAQEFEAHVDEFLVAVHDLAVALDIKRADRAKYAQEARFSVRGQ